MFYIIKFNLHRRLLLVDPRPLQKRWGYTAEHVLFHFVFHSSAGSAADCRCNSSLSRCLAVTLAWLFAELILHSNRNRRIFLPKWILLHINLDASELLIAVNLSNHIWLRFAHKLANELLNDNIQTKRENKNANIISNQYANDKHETLSNSNQKLVLVICDVWLHVPTQTQFCHFGCSCVCDQRDRERDRLFRMQIICIYFSLFSLSIRMMGLISLWCFEIWKLRGCREGCGEDERQFNWIHISFRSFRLLNGDGSSVFVSVTRKKRTITAAPVHWTSENNGQ